MDIINRGDQVQVMFSRNSVDAIVVGVPEDDSCVWLLTDCNSGRPVMVKHYNYMVVIHTSKERMEQRLRGCSIKDWLKVGEIFHEFMPDVNGLEAWIQWCLTDDTSEGEWINKCQPHWLTFTQEGDS